MVTVAKSFDAPIKLVFPQDLLENGLAAKNFAMLGLGDIVIPGIFIALMLRYDRRFVYLLCIKLYFVTGNFFDNIPFALCPQLGSEPLHLLHGNVRGIHSRPACHHLRHARLQTRTGAVTTS